MNMKKVSLLIPIFSLTTGLIATIPLVACAQNQPVVENKFCTVKTIGECQFSIKISAWIVRSGATLPNFQYSNDNGKTWKEVDYKSDGSSGLIFNTTLPANSNIILKGDNPNGLPNVYNGSITMHFENDVELSGNIMSLLDNGKGIMTAIPNQYCFKSLFNRSHIKHVSKDFLPAVKLKPFCYSGLFINCAQLTDAPDLPSLNLEANCYDKMFYGCKNLMSTPALPSVNLADHCYAEMFGGCEKINNLPDLPATELKASCYSNMFNKCIALTNVNPNIFKNVTKLAPHCFEGMFARCENLVNPPLLPFTELEESCYKTMFSGCKKLSLQDDFALPAKRLTNNCYHGMFNECTSLTHTAQMGANSYADDCFNLMYGNCAALEQTMDSLPNARLCTRACNSMFANCTSLTIPPKLPSNDLGGEEAVMNCYSYMFLGCEKLEIAPDLMATQISGACYQGMFQNCTNIKSVRVGFTDWKVIYRTLATQGWFSGTSKTGKFYCKQELKDSDADEERFNDDWGIPSELDKTGKVISHWEEIIE